MCKSSTTMSSSSAVYQALVVVALPPPSNTNKTMTTLFWCTVSSACTLATLISLANMACFNSLTHPFTYPVIFFVSVISVSLHLHLFFNLGSIPTIDELSLTLITGFIEASGYIKYLSLVYPREDSVEVVVFFVALAVDVMAIVKLVEPREDGNVFAHAIYPAIVKVCRMAILHGRMEFWYLNGVIGALVFYYQFSRVLFKWRIRQGI